MRRFKGLDYKISSRKHLTIQRPVPPVFLGHRESPSPPRTPSGACWRSAAAAAQGSVLREADGQCPGQAQNCSWQHLIFDILCQFSSVAQSCLTCPSPTPRACSNSCPLSQWCHPTISSSVIPFSSRLQSFPASGSFPMSQFFTSGGQRIAVSASASVLPVNTQGWFPLGWTGWISLQSKGLSRVFCNTTIQKHQFFGAQLSL